MDPNILKKATAKLKEINAQKKEQEDSDKLDDEATMFSIQMQMFDSVVDAIEENTSVLKEILLKIK